MAEPITRRAALGTLGVIGVGVAAGTLAQPAGSAAQDAPAALGRHESVQDGLKRVFAGRPMKDGAGVIKLEVPPIAENGAVVPVSVEVAAPMTPTSYVKNIWIVADKNRIPIVARASLTPDAGQAFVGANIRPGETTDVRAVVEQSDGTLLTTKREVKVTVGGCGG